MLGKRETGSEDFRFDQERRHFPKSRKQPSVETGSCCEIMSEGREA